MSTVTEARSLTPPGSPAGGAPVVPPGGAPRVEGPDKVSGRARYAGDHRPDGLAYVWPVPATIARGAVRAVHADA